MRFGLKRGEIHALMGENEAGKSTFIKIITGVLQPDAGSIILDGKPISPKNAVESQKSGIAAIYQHATAFPDLSVAENIFMGREIKTKLGTLDRKKMNRLAKEYLAPFDPDIDVTKPISSLGVARQQLVEIAKALSQNARVLILDEPTASLTKFECEELYRILEELRDNGVSMIFITHKFEDMYRLATRVTVLRDAQYIGTYDVASVPEDELIAAMVGRKLGKLYPEKTARIGDEIFRVEALSKTGYFRDISFSVRKGEILALTGLVGAGRTGVCQAIFGIIKPDSGHMFLEGKLAEKANFFSVGTNDLVQYTYALDRQAAGLAPFYDENYEAVMTLIGIAADNAHKNGIEIGICGELAGEEAFIEKWAEFGVDYISLSRGAILKRRRPDSQ